MSNQKAAASTAKHTPPSAPALPYAYALIEESPGRFAAVLLEGVTARSVTRLEVNGDAEPAARAMARLTTAIERRTIAKQWGKP